MTDDGSYGGVVSAFPYAARHADSLLFRSYVVVAGLATVSLTTLFVLAVIRAFGATGAGFDVARAFVVVVALGVIAPVVVPVLLVARTHRRGIRRRRGYEVGLAIAGYLCLASIYGSTLAAMPETFVLDGETVSRPPASAAGIFAPVVAVLYAIPPAGSLAVPAAAALVAVIHYLRR